MQRDSPDALGTIGGTLLTTGAGEVFFCLAVLTSVLEVGCNDAGFADGI
jgi:hypothetical protein